MLEHRKSADGLWCVEIFSQKSAPHSPSIETTLSPLSTTAFTLIGRQQFSQSETRSVSPSIPSRMTRVSELQKGQEMVVVASRRLFPFSFQFFTRLAAVFAEEGGYFGIFALDAPI